MSNVVPFRRISPMEKHRGRTLCKNGFHKWQIVTEKKFDVKQGLLVTVFKCVRCGEEKIEGR